MIKKKFTANKHEVAHQLQHRSKRSINQIVTRL